MAKLIEKVYGEALFELAVEEGRTAELMEEIKLVQQVLSDNPVNEKEQVIEQVWGGKVSREVTGLMVMLLKKEHYGQLPQVLAYFLEQVREKERIGIAYVRTAVELSTAQREKVEKRLLETTSYRTFEMHFDVDPSLIGGMIIRIGDRVVDSSIKTRLENMSRQLYQIKLQ